MKHNLIALLAVALVIIRVGAYFLRPPLFKEGDRIRITTTIRSEPVRFDNSQYLKILGLGVYMPVYPEVSYGDRVVLEGRVEGKRLVDVDLKKIDADTGFLYNFRKKILDLYKSSLPPPYSSLVAGVSIGSKSDMPSDFWDSLKNTGTAHVVVASGMNVSLVAGFLVSFFTFFLHRRKALYLALLGVWIYSFMSGLDAPIVRAAIMGSIAFSAQEFGRVNFSVRALFITSFFMIFINPSYLSDRGFWLSISSTLGMIVLGSRINNSLVRLPAGLRESISSSLAAQVGAAPFLFLFFGRFNFLSPLINALVLWTVVPITIIGLLAGLIGGVVPVIGRLMLLLAYPLTFWFVYIVKLFSWDF